VAARLGLVGVCLNSMDAVSDRDFALELMPAFRFDDAPVRSRRRSRCGVRGNTVCPTLGDQFSPVPPTWPQREKPGHRVSWCGQDGPGYGDLIALLPTMKALPLAYNKDMQEDKERSLTRWTRRSCVWRVLRRC
jgi:hypothetical protein